MAESLRTVKRIGIAGAGGIGGFVARFIFDYGAMRNQFPFNTMDIKIFDDDTVDASNLLHQDFTQEDLGKSKCEIMANRYALTPVSRFMTTADFKDFDVVFSCVDSMTFRKDLYTYGFDHPELFWIDGRCNSRSIGLFNSNVPRKNLERALSDSTERKGCLRQVDKDKKISHATPVIVAGMITQCFLNWLRGENMTQESIMMI